MSRQPANDLVFNPALAESKTNILVPASSPVPKIDLETRLNQFIQTALKKSRSRDYCPYTSMKLLDKAWKAQKTLWRLRYGKGERGKGKGLS
ncbi:hypothetical protein K9N68_15070 [Kovacikia minuta CCNUW1]|uniref:hypothetical protein n=1 Tax=Kovacikia minuta TaxID=2931930 RepID=UPI001CCB92CA|nr:hypothetical protein [Kovacikia minuta]UBF29039.1 hypothetical protein K9N68_15070 [Kovacikia minuta CCNUW1]